MAGTPRSPCAARRPSDRPLAVSRDGGRVLVHDGPDLIAEGVPARLDLEVPPAAHPGRGRGGRPALRRLRPPLLPRMLRVRARAGPRGRVAPLPRLGAGPGPGGGPGAGRRLAAREPDGFLALEIVWSLLDCPGAWAVERHMEETGVVLGRMAARVAAPFPAGGAGVAVGWPLGRDGRKLYSGTALFGADGRLHGCARQTWIVLAADS